MTNLTIRFATPEDVPAVFQLIKDLAEYEKSPDSVISTEADLKSVLFGSEKSAVGQPAAYAHVAEMDGKVVGFAIWFLNYSTWLGKHGIYLEDLFVSENFRGQGIGKALLKTLAQLAVDRGYGRFEWWVLDWNKPAIDFYRAHGAVAMDEWTVYRLTGAELENFANQAD